MILLTPNPANMQDRLLITFLDRLQRVYTDMDREYARAAEYYGFQCAECRDNCCRSRFYHHTYLEFLYIRSGFENMDPQRRRVIQSKAKEVCRKTSEAHENGIFVRLMCPLNEDGLCTLYAHRPMICRLHGIAHQLQKPGQGIIHGPGCKTFDDRCAEKDYCEFDRTPYYYEMAKLEGEFKQATELTGRIKLTVAEMIMGRGQKTEIRGRR